MANRALVARLEQRDTGRLRVGRGASELHVCVWDGEIVAAVSADDLRHVLRRLLLAGELDADRVQELLAMQAMGAAVFGTLLDEVDLTVIEDILFDRFVENLTRYLGSAARPRFSHLPVIYADNFQTGHDPAALLQSSADAWDDAMSVDLDMEVFPGAAPAKTDLQRVVLARLGAGTTISRLLVQLPAEPFSARALIARMLRARMVDASVPPEADTQHTNGKPHPGLSNAEGALDMRSGERFVPDADTPISVGEMLTPEQLELDDPPTDRHRVADIAGDDELDDPPTEEVSRRAEALRLQELAAEDEAQDLDLDLGEDDLPADPADGAGDLTSLDAWMNHGVSVEEDLDAFSDHDDDRGAAGDGSFTTEQHNLDRVEVVEPLAEPEPEVPTAKFGAPVLSENDARAKIRVANGVLQTVFAAMDHAEGHGRGQAALQILLDGSPSQYQALFTGLGATDDGQLPPGEVLRNLHHRPSTEHRRLLNQGLLNLIERALSLAVEELPDEAIDTVLEDVAGYRQRLGL